MKKILLTTAIIAGLAASTSASANTSGGAYMGIQGGYSWSNFEPSSQIDDAKLLGLRKTKNKKTDQNGVGADIHFGYLFPITDSFSIGPEVGIGKNFYKPKYKTYVSYNHDDTFGIKSEVDTKLYVPILLRAQLQLNDELYVFGKVGAAYMDQKVTTSVYRQIPEINFHSEAEVSHESNKRWVGNYGVGMGYNINQNLGLEISYNYLDGDNGKERKGKAFRTLKTQNVSLGVNYTF